MGIQLQLLMIACIVNFNLKNVQPDKNIDQFQYVFNSVANNHTQNKESYRRILRQDVAWERQAFDTMKEELQTARNRKALKRKHFYEKINTHENMVPRKRETNESEPSPGPIHFTENPIANELRILHKDACEELIRSDVKSFMVKSVASFKHLCQSMSYSHYMGYRNVYNDILATAFVPFNNGSTQFCTGLKPGLVARNDETTFLLEFVVNRNSSIAMAEIDKYKNNFYNSKTDIFGIGINFHFVEAPYGYKNINASVVDKLYCDWEAKLYSKTGEAKKIFPREVEVLHCPY